MDAVIGSELSVNEISRTTERRVVFVRRRHAAVVRQHSGHYSVSEAVPRWSWAVTEQRWWHEGRLPSLFVVNHNNLCQLWQLGSASVWLRRRYENADAIKRKEAKLVQRSIVTANALLFFFLLLPLFHLFFLARASSPWKEVKSTWNFNTMYRMVSVLIATFFLKIWLRMTKLDPTPICQKNGAVSLQLQQATVCPPRHIEGRGD